MDYGWFLAVGAILVMVVWGIVMCVAEASAAAEGRKDDAREVLHAIRMKDLLRV